MTMTSLHRRLTAQQDGFMLPYSENREHSIYLPESIAIDRISDDRQKALDALELEGFVHRSTPNVYSSNADIFSQTVDTTSGRAGLSHKLEDPSLQS